MTELRDMPEPDGPLTDKQLDAVARMHFYETLYRAGLTIKQVDRVSWDTVGDDHKAYHENAVRGMVICANAHWGRHVRRRQAELLWRKGHINSTVAALSVIIAGSEDNVAAAQTIRDLLDLP